MPIHDWTRVDAGIFHHFHHAWIEEISRALHGGRLPDDYYALAEQFAGGFGPDVLTLQDTSASDADAAATARSDTALLSAPKLQVTGETDMAYYRRKQSAIVIRHVSADRIVAVIEVVSPGNKASRNPLRAFVDKAAHLLDNGVHLLVVDLHPPSRRDPQGIHGKIWDAIAGEKYTAPPGKRLTLAAYESAVGIRAYVVNMAVGDTLADMPVFLEPGQAVTVPLEATYQAAYAQVPRRWQRVLETSS
jgi:hypothetical protein